MATRHREDEVSEDDASRSLRPAANMKPAKRPHRTEMPAIPSSTPVSIVCETPAASALRRAFSAYESSGTANAPIQPLSVVTARQQPATGPRHFHVVTEQPRRPLFASHDISQAPRLDSIAPASARFAVADLQKAAKTAWQPVSIPPGGEHPPARNAFVTGDIRRRLFSVKGRDGRVAEVPYEQLSETPKAARFSPVVAPPLPEEGERLQAAKRDLTVRRFSIENPMTRPFASASKRRRVSFEPTVTDNDTLPSPLAKRRERGGYEFFVCGADQRTQPVPQSGASSSGSRGFRGPLQAALAGALRKAQELVSVVSVESPPASAVPKAVRDVMDASLVVKVDCRTRCGALIVGRVLLKPRSGSLERGERVALRVASDDGNCQSGATLFVPEPWTVLRSADNSNVAFDVNGSIDATVLACCTAPLPAYASVLLRRDDEVARDGATVRSTPTKALSVSQALPSLGKACDTERAFVAVKQHRTFAGISPHESVVGLWGQVVATSLDLAVTVVRDANGEPGLLRSTELAAACEDVVDLGIWLVDRDGIPLSVIERLLGATEAPLHAKYAGGASLSRRAPVFSEARLCDLQSY